MRLLTIKLELVYQFPMELLITKRRFDSFSVRAVCVEVRAQKDKFDGEGSLMVMAGIAGEGRYLVWASRLSMSSPYDSSIIRDASSRF